MNSLKERISAARGEKPADLVLKNGQLVNVFSGEIYSADVAIAKGYIVGVGDYAGEEEIDLNGRYITPGFIDSHLHIESTLLSPGELARAIVPKGTTAVICDPLEIANVLGVAGIKYLLEASEGLPVDIFFAVPSCVPATVLETSGGKVLLEDIVSLLKKERVIRLGEVMNFPDVLSGKKETLEKLEAACEIGIEGHAPGLTGKDLNAYLAAGISTDHETTTLDEAQEKLKNGMQILVRQGSSAKNLEAILPLIQPLNSRFFAFCTDDIYPSDLAQGHINMILKKAVELKLDRIIAIQLATINAARFYGLKGYGAIAPGYYADINVVANLEDFTVDLVFKRGKKVASRNKPLFETKLKRKAGIRETVKVKPFEVEALMIKAKSEYAKAIELVPGQTLTKSIVVSVKNLNGFVVSDPDSDVLKLVVIERHKASGKIGLGLVKGFGLKNGALATSIAHDSHNIICAGVDDEDMISAVRRVVELEGGMVVVRGGLVLAELPLPIAGLISDQPLDKVLEKLKILGQALKELGCKIEHPFGILSFLSLPVIPELRLTNKGLVDVAKFKIVDLFE
ncbi:MAG: adenine deaminase [Candidatus Margulisbacteria bacterium]|nr:adenine deaminase [Candidatus Margulisiibacteriota bacterium]